MRSSWSRLIGAIGLGFGLVPAASAQLLPPAEPTATLAAQTLPKSLAVDCSKVVDGDRRAAIEQARRLFEQHWLLTERGFFAAYTMPAEKRNPFDLTAKSVASPARNGFVMAKSVVCSLEAVGPDQPQAPLRIRFMAPLYRFHEIGRWSQPMRDGLIMEIEAMPSPGGPWQVRETKHEKAVLEPEAPARRPEAADLPKSGRWPEPIPGCRRNERWTGDACVGRKAKA